MNMVETTTKSNIRKKIKKYTTKRLETNNLQQTLSSEMIADRFRIKQTLPAVGPLNFYIVTDHINKSLCGNCGTENRNELSDYCESCGFFLQDCTFILIEGDHLSISGFDPFIENNLSHKNILTFFDKFYFNGNYYLIAQHLENETLINCDMEIDNQIIFDWALAVLNALDYLHQHQIVSVDLSLKNIFLWQTQPKLVNFAYAIHSPKISNHLIISDLKSYGNSFMTLLSRVKTPDMELKNIFKKATQKTFHKASDIYSALLNLKQELETGQVTHLKTSRPCASHQGMSTLLGKASNTGKVRSLNEDSVAALELTNILQSISSPVGLYVIADGMGGHDAGEDASKIAVQYTVSTILKKFDNSTEIDTPEAKRLLEDAVFGANREICNLASNKQNDMGTTITVALLIENKVFILNVGDARTYHYSNDKIKLITEDHSLVYRLFKAGQLTYDEMNNHPDSNQILSALGDPNLEMSIINLAQQANHPYFFNLELNKGDGLFLCSDGLWQMIPDLEIESILNKNSHPQEAVNELIYLANKNGGDDNISIIFVKIF